MLVRIQPTPLMSIIEIKIKIEKLKLELKDADWREDHESILTIEAQLEHAESHLETLNREALLLEYQDKMRAVDDDINGCILDD